MGFFTYIGEMIKKVRDERPYIFYPLLVFLVMVILIGLGDNGDLSAVSLNGNANLIAVLESRIVDLERSLEAVSSSKVSLAVVPEDGSGWYSISESADLYTQYRYILNDLGYTNIDLKKGFSGIEEGYNFIVSNDKYGVEQINYVIQDLGDVDVAIHIVTSLTEVDSELGTNVVDKLPLVVERSGGDIRIFEGLNKEVELDGR